MRCYQCGCQLSEHDFCTGCGADVSIYKKIMAISNKFYNEGLEKATVRDLTGAINCLRQSLKFNKNNVEARNLLGLCYFETGEVVAALSEWVISKNLRPKKNIADTYIDMVQSNPTKLETINQTIKKYNQALLYCEQDAKDLAVIQLKKVLSLNPKFVRAHQLLALLYIDREDWARAERELIRCEQIDTGSTTTKRYLKEVEIMLHPEEEGPRKNNRKAKAEKEKKPVRYTSDNEIIIQPVDVKEPKGVSISSFVYLLMGLAIGAAAAIFLVLPARIQNAKSDVSEQLKVVSEQLSVKSATIEELEQKIAVLENEKKSLHEELEAYVGTDGTIQTMDDMMSAINTYLSQPEDMTDVAGYLERIQEEVKIEETSETFQSVYNTLLMLVGPSVAEGYYNDGVDALKKEMYPDAISNLQKAYLYDTENIDILYNLANAYYQSGDADNAATYFEQIVTKFPDSERAKKSSQLLEEIEAAR